MKKISILTLLISMLTVPLLAQADEEKKDEIDPAKQLKTLGFGFALGVEQYRAPYIEEATTNGPNRIVTVDKEYKTLPSFWATINWNIVTFGDGEVGFLSVNKTAKVGVGLFAGVKLIGGPGNQAFDGFALGPQITFKTTGTTPRDISLGAGWVTHKTRGLAAGIVEGQSLPAAYTDVKFRQSSENSVAVMLSISL